VVCGLFLTGSDKKGVSQVSLVSVLEVNIQPGIISGPTATLIYSVYQKTDTLLVSEFSTLLDAL